MQKLVVAILMMSSFVCLGRSAEAFTIEGVEFTGFLTSHAPRWRQHSCRDTGDPRALDCNVTGARSRCGCRNSSQLGTHLARV